LRLIRQPKGGRVDFPKSTVNHIYAVANGKARFTVGGGFVETLDCGDLIAAPCWHAHSIEAEEDAVVFQVSDEPLLTKLGLARTAVS
jgi:gentisate 1,2-dioxygenase